MKYIMYEIILYFNICKDISIAYMYNYININIKITVSKEKY